MDHPEYTISNQNNKTSWNNAVRFCLREQPLYKSEYKIYSNGYKEPIKYKPGTPENKNSPVIDSVRQKWQYHILKYLETNWIENPNRPR